MMKYLVLILAAPVASAFVLQPPVVLVRPTFALHKSRDSFDAASAADVDMARAKECAEKFGICSVKEVEDLRDCEYTTMLCYRRSGIAVLTSRLSVPHQPF
jgi:hypothetical protein